MKRNLILFAIICSVCLLNSCESKYKDNNTVNITKEINSVRFEDNKERKEDANFLAEVSAYNTMIVEISDIAINKTLAPVARNLAESMVVEHQKIEEELKILARKKSIDLPNDYIPEVHHTKEKFKYKIPGKTYDENYIAFIEKAYQKMEGQFKNLDRINDEELKYWATKVNSQLLLNKEIAKALEEKEN